MFGVVLLGVSTVMQAYIFWRATTVPWITRRIPKRAIILAGVLLWLVQVLGRTVGHDSEGYWAAGRERARARAACARCPATAMTRELTDLRSCSFMLAGRVS